MLALRITNSKRGLSQANATWLRNVFPLAGITDRSFMADFQLTGKMSGHVFSLNLTTLLEEPDFIAVTLAAKFIAAIFRLISPPAKGAA